MVFLWEYKRYEQSLTFKSDFPIPFSLIRFSLPSLIPLHILWETLVCVCFKINLIGSQAC